MEESKDALQPSGEVGRAAWRTPRAVSIVGAMPNPGAVWSTHENELLVASYLEMLLSERHGRAYVKAEYWRALHQTMPARSQKAVEAKARNVSAVLLDLGFPTVDGLAPYFNYQAELRTEVERQLASSAELVALVRAQVEQLDRPAVPSFDVILSAMVETPTAMKPTERRAQVAWYEKPSQTAPFDFLHREARNVALGDAGEEFALAYEQARLVAAGKERLAAKVEHVARTRGAASGFDILSYEKSGKERLVEVKTTRFNRHTPFFVSRNEVLTSDTYANQYRIYRLFDFDSAPRLFELAGSVRASCELDPTEYQARAR